MKRPRLVAHCVDCAADTMTMYEFYMVHDHVWELAWAGRRKSWLPHAAGPDELPLVGGGGRHARDHEFLCVGCLERRIGRTLTRHDFTDASINLLAPRSSRLRDRLTADRPGSAESRRCETPMIITILASSDRHNLYRAVSSAGVTLVERSPSPLLDSARVLAAQGYSSHPLEMIRAGSTFVALTASSVGYAASLEVGERGFRPYRPPRTVGGPATSIISSGG